MSYYQLPRIYHTITTSIIKLKFIAKDNESFINKSLSSYLNMVKQEIQYYIMAWDDVKKFTNPYE